MEWGELYAHLAMSTGWTLEYIRESMDIPTLKSFTRYWEQFPPLHIIAAHYTGAAKPRAKQASEGELSELDNDAKMEELMGMFPVVSSGRTSG